MQKKNDKKVRLWPPFFGFVSGFLATRILCDLFIKN